MTNNEIKTNLETINTLFTLNASIEEAVESQAGRQGVAIRRGHTEALINREGDAYQVEIMDYKRADVEVFEYQSPHDAIAHACDTLRGI